MSRSTDLWIAKHDDEAIPPRIRARRKQRKSVVGSERYGYLITVSVASKMKNGAIKWLCNCDCGQQREVLASNLVRGHTTSCGCRMTALATKHGLSRTPEYRAWINMKTRCNDPNTSEWHRYGGRGITICERWAEFNNFLADMGPRPRPGYSVDRVNFDGNYEPSNCRWADSKTQCRNMSVNRIVEINGKEMTLAEAVEITGVKYNTILYRLKRGWPVERALTEVIHAKGS